MFLVTLVAMFFLLWVVWFSVYESTGSIYHVLQINLQLHSRDDGVNSGSIESSDEDSNEVRTVVYPHE
jgi:hypothetical protein